MPNYLIYALLVIGIFLDVVAIKIKVGIDHSEEPLFLYICSSLCWIIIGVIISIQVAINQNFGLKQIGIYLLLLSLISMAHIVSSILLCKYSSYWDTWYIEERATKSIWKWSPCMAILATLRQYKSVISPLLINSGITTCIVNWLGIVIVILQGVFVVFLIYRIGNIVLSFYDD